MLVLLLRVHQKFLTKIPFVQFLRQKKKKSLVKDLIDRVPEELWTEVCDFVQEAVIKTILRKKKCKKAKWLPEEALQVTPLPSYSIPHSWVCFWTCLVWSSFPWGHSNITFSEASTSRLTKTEPPPITPVTILTRTEMKGKLEKERKTIPIWMQSSKEQQGEIRKPSSVINAKK